MNEMKTMLESGIHAKVENEDTENEFFEIRAYLKQYE
jgi:hypothetical protein